MKFTPLDIPGLVLVEPDIFRDSRGLFYESYHRKTYEAGGIKEEFVQHNHSQSARGVLRGLHLQLNRSQGKLVRVIAGEAFDVAVDVRLGSPTFKRWASVNLSGENFKQLYIPPGFAHGFVALSDSVEFEYKCTDFYDKASEAGIAWNDPEIGITWPITHPILSDKDRAAPLLSAIINKLPRYSA